MRFSLFLQLNIILTFMHCFGGREIIPQAVVMAASSSNGPRSYGTFDDHKPINRYNDDNKPINRYNQECCPICLDSINKIVEKKRIYLPCDHMLCSACNKALKDKKCPICREPIPQKPQKSYYCRSCTLLECCIACEAALCLCGCLLDCCGPQPDPGMVPPSCPLYFCAGLMFVSTPELSVEEKSRVPFCECKTGDEPWCKCNGCCP